MTHEAEVFGLYVRAFPDAYICAKEYPVGIFYEEVTKPLLIFRVHRVAPPDKAADAGVDVYIRIVL